MTIKFIVIVLWYKLRELRMINRFTSTVNICFFPLFFSFLISQLNDKKSMKKTKREIKNSLIYKIIKLSKWINFIKYTISFIIIMILTFVLL